MLNLKKNYSGELEQNWISLTLASFYEQYADKQKQPDFYQKSLNELQAVLQLKDSPKLVAIAKSIQKNIESQDLKIMTEDYGSPDKPAKALVKFRNVDTLYLSVYTDLKPEIKKGLVKADSVWKLLDSAKLVKEKEYVLPQVKKGFEYSSEFLLPKLPQGHYLFLFSSKQNPDFNKDIYAWREINFSQLAFFQSWNGKDLQFYVSDRESGKPISEAEVDFSFKTSSKSQKKYQLKTNSEGLATISPENINNSVDISGFVSKEKDSLFFGNQPYLWKQTKEKEHKKSYSINSYLLTDRKIFRPGQTLYFKGFVAFQKDKKQQTADKFPVKISLYDSDHNLVEEKQLITNKMGSVEGEFKLPKSGLTGKYSLEITEGVENGKWKKYVDKFKKERINIQVEEYKRPRFEVKFEDLAETYFLKDSVQLQANAKAFFGGNLSNAEVRYTLKRSLEYTPQMDYQIYRTYNKAETLKTGELKTDENGHFQIDFIAEPQNEISKETDPIYNYTLEVEVTDINGETHTTEKSVKISYSGINAELLSPEEVVLGKENEAVLSFKDLNQTSTAAKGELKIYQYKVPKRVFKERVWEIPEYQMISKEDFRKYYPYEVYDSLDLKENWTKKLVKTLEVSKAEKWNLKYDEIEELKPGEYLLEFKGEGVKNLPLKIQKTISISAPEKSKELTEFVKSTFEETGKSNSPKIKAEFEASEDLYILWEVANDKNWKTQKVLELKKGKNIFEIDFPKNSQLLGSQYFYIKANDYFSKGNMIDRKQEKTENLQFEIEHFTDKLHPGNKEIWKLKLLDNQGKPVKAEVLASMYDASLDSFIKENTDWNINLQETPWRYYIPRPNLSNIIGYSFGKKTSFSFNIPRKIYFTQSFFNTTDLETFGYNFVYTQRAQTEHLEKLENKFPFFDENTKEAKVSGVVVDQDGLPIPGTQIQLNSKKKTTTDLEGRFTISAKFGDTLQVSSIGFKDILIKVFTSNIKVQVKEGGPLEEVAVSYSQVSAPQALAGRVNGLTSNADLNETSKHTEKALDVSSSINLFIVDGKPMTKEEVLQINADEIIQIDILKAEEAVKLYGNQANNGAAVIITKSSLEDLQEIKPRENLQETAFFYPNLKTDKKGNINIEFETPEALTRWKFQAFAHDKNLQQAYIMRHAITQKDLNIIPNFPRFFRAGDTIQISAKVNNLSKKALNGQVLLKFTDEIKQKEINLTLNSEKSNVKNFVLEAKENAETYWEIIIPEGVEALRYEISAKAENFTDAETNIIPVLSQREFLTESLPLWVEPQQEKSFVLENLQNQTSKSLKNHKLIFDFTARPIWTAIEAMPYLTQETYASADRIFDLYYSYTLGERILKENKDIAELVKS